MAELKEIRIPDLGDFEEVDVIEVLVSAGDEVEVEDGLITLETDKASMDVPSTAAGTVREVKVSAGDKVNEGDVIAIIETAGEGGDETDEETGGQTGEKEGGQADGEPDESAEGTEESPPERAEEGAGEEAAAGGESEAEGDTAAEPGRRKVTVPDLGDFEEVDVIEVHVSEGDEVGEEDSLITLETDKASMDVPSPAAGKVAEIAVSVGDKVSSGDEIMTLLSAGDGEAAAAEAAREEPGEERERDEEEKKPAEKGKPEEEGREDRKPQEARRPERDRHDTDEERAGPDAGEREQAEDAEARRAVPSGFPAIEEAGFSRAHASPSVRKLAREMGVNLARVEGSGRKGRILADDVKAWVKKTLKGGAPAEGASLPSVPEVDFAKFGDTVTEPLGRIRRISARRLHASWVNLPHVTQHDLADITGLEERRQELKGPAAERGVKLTPLAFIMKACVQALKEFPRFNSSLHADGAHLVLKHYFHIGFAVDTPNGLVVPVIRDADRKDVYELASELGELSEGARAGSLSAAQMQGGTFTITSLGGIGGTAFTPIINAPEVAILGVSRASRQPVWNGSEFEPRLMLPLSLSYDHRVIDGAEAARFTTWLSDALGDVSALLEAIP